MLFIRYKNKFELLDNLNTTFEFFYLEFDDQMIQIHNIQISKSLYFNSLL